MQNAKYRQLEFKIKFLPAFCILRFTFCIFDVYNHPAFKDFPFINRVVFLLN